MTTKRTRTTRPLRSSPITGPSPLLRGGPSPCRASVLSPSQFQLLGVLPSAAGVNTPAGAITARGSHVSCQRPDRARATSVPGNRQGSKQVSPWLFPGQQLDPGYDCRRYAYDTSAVVHSRSPSRSPPDASRAPFPWCSSPRLIHRSNPRWFTASPCRAAVEGLPPSPAQHRNHQRDLLHRNLQSRSWRTVVREALEPDIGVFPFQPHIERVVGSPRGVSPRGSHGTERDRLRSFRSSHPLHRYARIHAQCAKSSGSLAVSPRHQALNRFHVRSRLYFLRAHRIK